MNLKTILLFGLFCGNFLLFAQEDQAKIKTILLAAASEDNKQTVQIQLQVREDLELNLKAPWKLNLANANTQENVQFDKTHLKGLRFEFSLPKGKYKGQLIAFTCTKDKSICYKDEIPVAF